MNKDDVQNQVRQAELSSQWNQMHDCLIDLESIVNRLNTLREPIMVEFDRVADFHLLQPLVQLIQRQSCLGDFIKWIWEEKV